MFNCYINCWGCDSVYIALTDPSLVGHTAFDNPEQKSSQRTGKKLLKTSAAPEMLPFLDHWNTPTKKVSLREIMSEEIALQEKFDLVWVSASVTLLSSWLVFALWFSFPSVFLVWTSYFNWLKLMLKLKNVLNIFWNWRFFSWEIDTL
jgi:hypothetical protein